MHLIVNGPGDRAAAQEHRITIVVCLIQIDLRLLCGGIAQHALVVLLQRFDGECRLREVGLGIVEGDLELPGIEAVEHLAGGDVLILRDIHIFDDAGDVGRDANLLGFDIGVISGHDLAAAEVPVTSSDERERQ